MDETTPLVVTILTHEQPSPQFKDALEQFLIQHGLAIRTGDDIWQADNEEPNVWWATFTKEGVGYES